MGDPTTDGPSHRAASGSPDPEQLESEIAAQRERLAQTVDQLTAKLDVKSQAQARVAGLKDSATTPDGKPRPEVLAAAGSLVAVVVVLLVWRSRR